jgi:hypothetical protein
VAIYLCGVMKKVRATYAIELAHHADGLWAGEQERPDPWLIAFPQTRGHIGAVLQ